MKVLKLILGVLLSALVLAGIFAFAMIGKGGSAFEQTYSMEYDDAMVPSDSRSLQLGKFIAESHGCQGCHGKDFEGLIFADAPPFLAVGTNLTSGAGGIGSTYSDADWLRSIRHGVAPDGRGLMIMPSEAYYYLNDQEAGALVAYLKSLDPVDNELPPFELRPLGKLIMGVSDDMSTAPNHMRDATRIEAERGVTAEWGEYRSTVMCQVCHGGDMQCGQPPDPESMMAPDMRVVKSWGLDAFLEFFEDGTNPSGVVSSAQFMPWDKFSYLGEDELTAIYMYLETL